MAVNDPQRNGNEETFVNPDTGLVETKSQKEAREQQQAQSQQSEPSTMPWETSTEQQPGAAQRTSGNRDSGAQK